MRSSIPARPHRLEVHPHALVVVESMFGNTERLARAVATGLTIEGIDTRVVHVDEAPAIVRAEVDLLVLGAPTHVFSLSRPRTRADAVKQGAPAATADLGMRDWLESAAPADPSDPSTVAAFDSRVARPRVLPHTAARRALALAEQSGFRAGGFGACFGPQSFLVDDVGGPISEGECDRALAWGRELGRDARYRVAEADSRHRAASRRRA